ncbi:41689_t:CDS:2, partial [Gigaspora margarita]
HRIEIQITKTDRSAKKVVLLKQGLQQKDILAELKQQELEDICNFLVEYNLPNGNHKVAKRQV